MSRLKKIITVALSTTLIASVIPKLDVNADTSIITRFSGLNRYDTSLSISKNGWTTANSVIIATGQSFPDALCAAPLSKKKNAPIILTEKQALSSDIVNEIHRLQAKEAYIVGGAGVVSENVENQLKALGLAVQRYAGLNRYETSVKVAKEVGTEKGIVIATGSNFPDALSIAPIAAMEGMPILLSETNSLPLEVDNLLKTSVIPKSYLIGGIGVLSDELKAQLPNAKRLSGASRYETNLNIIKEFEDSLNFNDLYVATGKNFPDALSGSALAAKLNAPILLSDGSISANAESYLQSLTVRRVNLLGGTGVINETLAAKLQNTVKYETISYINPIFRTAYLNEKYTLPTKVLAGMSNRNLSLASVAWDTKIADTSNPGTYTFQGTVEGYNNKVVLTLKVCGETSYVNRNCGNGGSIAAKENLLYYLNPSDNNALTRIDSNFIGKMRISTNEKTPYNISAVGNNIYYLDKSRPGVLFKANADGTKEQIAIANNVYTYYILGNAIYYSSGEHSNNTGIRKIDIDSKNDTLVYQETASEIIVKEDWIFFTNNNDGNNIYKVKTDGSQATKLSTLGGNRNIVIMDSYIFSLIQNNIYITLVDGGSTSSIGGNTVRNFSVLGSWIYYTDISENSILHKMSIWGNNNKDFTNYPAKSLYISGEYIYITSNNSCGLRKIRMDDTETQQYGESLTVNTPTMLQPQLWYDEVFLEWLPSNNAAYYEVYRSNTENGGYSLITNTSATNFSDKTVKPSYTYWYRVRAITKLNEKSDFSNAIPVNVTNAPSETVKRGNTGGNLLNGGWAAADNEYFYYIDWGDFGDKTKIIKINSQGEKTLVIEGYDLDIFNINALDGYIYYYDTCQNLYRIKNDGSCKTRLNTDYKVKHANIIGEWIYYCNVDDFSQPNIGQIYRMRLDGSNKTLLYNSQCFITGISRSWIYYKDCQDPGALYKMHLDGSGKEKVNIRFLGSPNFIGDWIYYSDILEENIYRIKSDGSSKTKLCNDKVHFLNVDNGWIYYTNVNENYKLYKMQLDGTNKTKISDDNCSMVQVIGEWIYYHGSEGSIYKIKLDGTGKVKIN